MAILLLIASSAIGSDSREAETLPKVAAVDLSRWQPSLFSDSELEIPFLLAHFNRVANSILDQGDNRGFIDIPVWRRQNDNQPYNARIMENCLALAFFYCTERPWNPYYRDPALKRRLEAALDFWCRIQNDDGRFSEYGPRQWNLAATAFATKFMGETLRLLHDGPLIDPALHRRVVSSQRKAIICVLTDASFYRTGRSYSNQFSNVWPGGLSYLSLYPDPEMERRLRKRIKESDSDFQSPAGYFYEANGPDWGYNLETHHSNLHGAWFYVRGTDLEPVFLKKVQRWYDWFSYNALREPDGSGYVLNRAIETRLRIALVRSSGLRHRFKHAGTPQAVHVPIARAFIPSQKERKETLMNTRKRLENNWPDVDPLQVGAFHAYTPYYFLHRSHGAWHPTPEQKAEAIASLPYLDEIRFLHQRADNRLPVTFTFIRRPSFYVAFNSGRIIRANQRYGIGVLWSPSAGALLQSQTGTHDASWGTSASGAKMPYEATSFYPVFTVDAKTVLPKPGNHDLPDGIFNISYPLAKRGEKTLRFEDSQILVSIRHPGNFRECIPLLLGPSDQLEWTGGQVVLRHGGPVCTIVSHPSIEIAPKETEHVVGRKRVHSVFMIAKDQLDYRIVFSK